MQNTKKSVGPDDSTWDRIVQNIDINVDLWPYAGPGGWNDPCLLIAEDMNGKQRITEVQSRYVYCIRITIMV